MNLALFDLDGTLLPFDTNHAFGVHLARRGWLDEQDWVRRNEAFFRAHERGVLDIHAYVDFATAAWRDRPCAEAEEARASFVREVLQPALPAPALALVARHRAAGDLTALVTATNEFLAEPIARAFGIEHLVAVRLARDERGRVTGRIAGVPSFGGGKTVRVDEWLHGRGLSREAFARVAFYGDSINDVPLMERVSDPVATNPGAALRELATRRGWRVVDLFD